MEGFELLSTGAWSILPPLLALGLALITKEVYSSLLVGVFSGLIIYEFCLEGVGFDQNPNRLLSHPAGDRHLCNRRNRQCDIARNALLGSVLR